MRKYQETPTRPGQIMGDIASGGYHYNLRGMQYISYTKKPEFDTDTSGGLLKDEPKSNNLKNKSQVMRDNPDKSLVMGGLVNNEIDIARATEEEITPQVQLQGMIKPEPEKVNM